MMKIYQYIYNTFKKEKRVIPDPLKRSSRQWLLLSLLSLCAINASADSPSAVIVSEGKPVAQSSLWHWSRPATNGNDGISDGNLGVMSLVMTPDNDNDWWEVDLQGPHTIVSGSLMRNTSYTLLDNMRLSYLNKNGESIHLSHEFMNNTHYGMRQHNGDYVAVTDIAQDDTVVKGVYKVRVQSARWLVFNELSLWGYPEVPIVNAWQSSDYHSVNYPASNAYDGNSYTFNHTESYGPAGREWLLLDLGRLIDLEGVYIENRGSSCCVSRLDSTVYFFKDNPRPVIQNIRDQFDVGNGFDESGQTIDRNQGFVDAVADAIDRMREPYTEVVNSGNLTVNGSSMPNARYIMLRQNDADYLHVDEIQVTGTSFEATGSGAGGTAYLFNDNAAGLTMTNSVDIGKHWSATARFQDLDLNGWGTLFRGNEQDYPVIIRADNKLGVFCYQPTCRNGQTGYSHGGFFDSGVDMTPYDDNKPHTLTAVGSGTTTTFYIDGVNVGSVPVKSEANITTIGNHPGASLLFANKLDHIQIHTVALTDDEIHRIARGDVITRGLEAHYDGETVNGKDWLDNKMMTGESVTATSISTTTMEASAIDELYVDEVLPVGASLHGAGLYSGEWPWSRDMRSAALNDDKYEVVENFQAVSGYDYFANPSTDGWWVTSQWLEGLDYTAKRNDELSVWVYLKPGQAPAYLYLSFEINGSWGSDGLSLETADSQIFPAEGQWTHLRQNLDVFGIQEGETITGLAFTNSVDGVVAYDKVHVGDLHVGDHVGHRNLHDVNGVIDGDTDAKIMADLLAENDYSSILGILELTGGAIPLWSDLETAAYTLGSKGFGGLVGLPEWAQFVDDNFSSNGALLMGMGVEEIDVGAFEAVFKSYDWDDASSTLHLLFADALILSDSLSLLAEAFNNAGELDFDSKLFSDISSRNEHIQNRRALLIASSGAYTVIEDGLVVGHNLPLGSQVVAGNSAAVGTPGIVISEAAAPITLLAFIGGAHVWAVRLVLDRDHKRRPQTIARPKNTADISTLILDRLKTPRGTGAEDLPEVGLSLHEFDEANTLTANLLMSLNSDGKVTDPTIVLAMIDELYEGGMPRAVIETALAGLDLSYRLTLSQSAIDSTDSATNYWDYLDENPDAKFKISTELFFVGDATRRGVFDGLIHSSPYAIPGAGITAFQQESINIATALEGKDMTLLAGLFGSWAIAYDPNGLNYVQYSVALLNNTLEVMNHGPDVFTALDPDALPFLQDKTPGIAAWAKADPHGFDAVLIRSAQPSATGLTGGLLLSALSPSQAFGRLYDINGVLVSGTDLMTRLEDTDSSLHKIFSQMTPKAQNGLRVHAEALADASNFLASGDLIEWINEKPADQVATMLTALVSDDGSLGQDVYALFNYAAEEPEAFTTDFGEIMTSVVTISPEAGAHILYAAAKYSGSTFGAGGDGSVAATILLSMDEYAQLAVLRKLDELDAEDGPRRRLNVDSGFAWTSVVILGRAMLQTGTIDLALHHIIPSPYPIRDVTTLYADFAATSTAANQLVTTLGQQVTTLGDYLFAPFAPFDDGNADLGELALWQYGYAGVAGLLNDMTPQAAAARLDQVSYPTFLRLISWMDPDQAVAAQPYLAASQPVLGDDLEIFAQNLSDITGIELSLVRSYLDGTMSFDDQIDNGLYNIVPLLFEKIEAGDVNAIDFVNSSITHLKALIAGNGGDGGDGGDGANQQAFLDDLKDASLGEGDYSETGVSAAALANKLNLLINGIGFAVETIREGADLMFIPKAIQEAGIETFIEQNPELEDLFDNYETYIAEYLVQLTGTESGRKLLDGYGYMVLDGELYHAPRNLQDDTDVPSGAPTEIPSWRPSGAPSAIPSNEPSTDPTSPPTLQPTKVSEEQMAGFIATHMRFDVGVEATYLVGPGATVTQLRLFVTSPTKDKYGNWVWGLRLRNLTSVAAELSSDRIYNWLSQAAIARYAGKTYRAVARAATAATQLFTNNTIRTVGAAGWGVGRRFMPSYSVDSFGGDFGFVGVRDIVVPFIWGAPEGDNLNAGFQPDVRFQSSVAMAGELTNASNSAPFQFYNWLTRDVRPQSLPLTIPATTGTTDAVSLRHAQELYDAADAAYQEAQNAYNIVVANNAELSTAYDDSQAAQLAHQVLLHNQGVLLARSFYDTQTLTDLDTTLGPLSTEFTLATTAYETAGTNFSLLDKEMFVAVKSLSALRLSGVSIDNQVYIDAVEVIDRLAPLVDDAGQLFAEALAPLETLADQANSLDTQRTLALQNIATVDGDLLALVSELVIARYTADTAAALYSDRLRAQALVDQSIDDLLDDVNVTTGIWNARNDQRIVAQTFFDTLHWAHKRVRPLASTDFEMGGGAGFNVTYNRGRRDETTNAFSSNRDAIFLAVGDIVAVNAAYYGLSATIGWVLANRSVGGLPPGDDPAALALGIYTNVDQTRTFLQSIVHPTTGKAQGIPLLAGYTASLVYGQMAAFAPGVDRNLDLFGWFALKPRGTPGFLGSYAAKIGVRAQVNVGYSLTIE